jgi:hypothetical protein
LFNRKSAIANRKSPLFSPARQPAAKKPSVAMGLVFNEVVKRTPFPTKFASAMPGRLALGEPSPGLYPPKT